jgi:small subunit ribosomal protein S1
VETPADVLKEDDQVSVKVIGVDTDASGGSPKIALSIKQLEGDPWDRVTERFHAGDKVKGTVTRCADFGAFVEIAPGTEGLVHISEMSYIKRILKPEDLVTPGDTVSVLVKAVDAENKRISLSMKDAEGDPWIEVPDKYPPGKAVSGTLEKKERFGYFITLAPGITGLMPISKISKSYDAGQIEKMKPGDAITVIVEEVNPRERKISLGPGDSADGEAWQEFTKPQSGPMGALGEKLQQALQAKEKDSK